MSASEGLRYNLRRLGLQIGKNVKNDGNCWYHSMTYLGYGRTARCLRIGLANLMHIQGDRKGIFPNQPDVSLKDIFSLTNEVDKVFDCFESNIREYNYDTMCMDMRTNGSWERLPMNLIMQLTSLLFDIEFRIVSDTAREDPLRVVWNESHKYSNHVDLAKLGEIHYLPLEPRDEIASSKTTNTYTDCDDTAVVNQKMQVFTTTDEADSYYEDILEMDNNKKVTSVPYIAQELFNEDTYYDEVSIDANGFEFVESADGECIQMHSDK